MSEHKTEWNGSRWVHYKQGCPACVEPPPPPPADVTDPPARPIE